MGDAELQEWQPYGMGLQVSYCVDYEISVFCSERRRWGAVSGIATRDCAEPGDDDPRRGDQSGSRAYACVDTSQFVGVEGGAVAEGEEFAQAAVGICLATEKILGPAFVGAWILGCFKRQRHRRHVAEIYRGSKTRDAGRPFQGCVAVDPRGRPNPASSRNLKPPALAGGRSHFEGTLNLRFALPSLH